MRRSILRGLVAAAATVFVAGLAVPSASAAPGCTIYPDTKVVIGARTTQLNVDFGPSCEAANTATATWSLRDAYGDERATVEYPGPEQSIYFDIPDDVVDVGRHTFLKTGARDADGVAIAQNTGSVTDIRFGSRATLETRRAGRYVAFTAKARRWSSTSHTYAAWSSMPGTIQFLSGSTWKNYRAIKTDASGNYNLTLLNQGVYTYRVVFTDLGSTWGAASSTTRR